MGGAMRAERAAHVLHPCNGPGSGLAMAYSAAAPGRKWLCVLEQIHQRGKSCRYAAFKSRRICARRAPPAQICRRPPERGMEEKLRGRRIVLRLRGTAGIDKHSSHPDLDHG